MDDQCSLLPSSAATSHDISPSRDKPTKVILWCTPRSLSTVLTKCLSFVQDSVIWFEPFVSTMFHGRDARFPAPSTPVFWEGEPGMDMHTRAKTVQLPENNGFDATQSSYKWCKEQLEADYPGKRVVFVKEMCRPITTRYDAIPRGYKHTFLIRHPLKVLPSWKRVIHEEADGPFEVFKLSACSESRVSPGFFFKESYDLYIHIKENLESNPIVLDADDLLANPGGVLKAYCDLVGIPYSDDLLHWPSSDEVVMRWNVAKQLLQISKLHDFRFHGKAFSSSEFGKPSKPPRRDDLTEDDLYCIDYCMPYYEKMYNDRLRC